MKCRSSPSYRLDLFAPLCSVAYMDGVIYVDIVGCVFEPVGIEQWRSRRERMASRLHGISICTHKKKRSVAWKLYGESLHANLQHCLLQET